MNDLKWADIRNMFPGHGKRYSDEIILDALQYPEFNDINDVLLTLHDTALDTFFRIVRASL